jgi:isopenicillin N synthase-like dioxygenase
MKEFRRDMAKASSRDPGERLRLAEQIRDACVRVGFFYSELRDNRAIRMSLINP